MFSYFTTRRSKVRREAQNLTIESFAAPRSGQLRNLSTTVVVVFTSRMGHSTNCAYQGAPRMHRGVEPPSHSTRRRVRS